jgi:hypothetical protein
MSVSHRFLQKVLFLIPRALAGVAHVPALALSTLFLLSPALRAQEPAPPGPPEAPEPAPPANRKPLSASGEFAVGSSLWGPVSGIQDALWDAGLNDPGDGGFLGSQTVTYPRIHNFPERVSYWVAGRQRLGGEKWSVGFGAGITGLGSAQGHRAGPAGGDGVYVTVQSSVFTVAPMLWLEAAPVLRLGLGPAVHAVDVDPGVSDTPDVKPPEGDNPIWRAGLLVEAALTLPAGKPYYFMLLGQYRWLADTSAVVPETGWPQNSVPVPLSHAYVAIGVGGRF